MGLYNFIIDAGQSSEIANLQERVEELESKVEEMAKWILMLKEQNETLHNQLSR